MLFRLNVYYDELKSHKTFNCKDTELIRDVWDRASENIAENEAKKYGLFLEDKTDKSKGIWLDLSRPISYYQMICDQATLIYKRKFILLKIRTLDSTQKKMELDESKTVGELMLEICSKMGIVNFEEYSLVREQQEEKTGTLLKTGTLSRGAVSSSYDRSDAAIGSTATLSKDNKMKQLRKKLVTDDSICWLNHAQTLREQGLYKDLDIQPLILRRKFFLSDRNVDTRDPVQLTLLYAQCVDGITSGRYPVTHKEATLLASLQLYIDRGINVKGEVIEQINWDEYLPEEYRGKGLEREIYERYKDMGEPAQAEVRLKYVQTCRQLRTYGIAIFLAKEKHEEKRKLRPVLLGITRDAVVRIKPKNREVLQEWPLTKIKQWEVRSNVFTLDFGEYGKPYSVQTQEGEQIARLLAGYADIISKKKQGVDYSPTSTMTREPHAPVVDTIQPQRATILTPHELATTLRRLKNPDKAVNGGSNPGIDNADSSNQNNEIEQTPTSVPIVADASSSVEVDVEIAPENQLLVSNFNSGIDVMNEAHKYFDEVENTPPHAPATDQNELSRRRKVISNHRQGVSSRLSEMSAATASIMTTTFTAASDGQRPDEKQSSDVAHAVSSISREMPPLCDDVRGLVLFSNDFEESNPDSRNNLLNAARRLASAFSDMFQAAHPSNIEPRQQLLTAATRVGEAADVLKISSGIPVELEEKSYQERLLALAKAVANATAQLVLRAKAVANRCETVANQNAIIQAATQCALATSQLVAVTKVVIASAADSPPCQDQLSNVGAQVTASVEKLTEMAPHYCPDDRMVTDMSQAAHQVTVCLGEFLGHVHGKPEQQVDPQDESHGPQTFTDLQASVVQASDRIINTNASGDGRETARSAGSLAQSASQLIVALRGIVAEERDDNQKQRLLGAARQLAEATTRLVASAKLYAEQQNCEENRRNIVEKAAQIRNMVIALTSTTNLSPEEQALDDAIADGLDQFNAASRRLNESVSITLDQEKREPQFWVDMKSSCLNQLSGRVCTMNAAAAQAVSATAIANANIAGVGNVSSPAVVECAVVTDAVIAIAMHAQPLAEDARNLAAVQRNEGDRDSVISATQLLTKSFTDLFLAAKPIGSDGAVSSSSDERRQKLWVAASNVGQAGGEFVVAAKGPVLDSERDFQEQVLALARVVSSSTAKLVLAAKTASNHCDGETSKNTIIQSATQSALAASQLVAVTRVVLPTLMSDQKCREQLIRSCGAVGIVAERLVTSAERECCDDQSVAIIQDSANIVGKSVAELVSFISLSPPSKRGQSVSLDVEPPSGVSKERASTTSSSNAEMVPKERSSTTSSSNAEVVPKERASTTSSSNAEMVPKERASTTSSSNAEVVPKERSSTTSSSNAEVVPKERASTTSSSSEEIVPKGRSSITSSQEVKTAIAKPKPPPPPPKKHTPTNAVIAASERVIRSSEGGEIASEANSLAHITGLLISAIKDKANGEDDQVQRDRLLDAARQLADATTTMLENAAVVPQDSQQATDIQTSVKGYAEQIRSIAVSAGPVQAVDKGGDKVVSSPLVKEFKPTTPAVEECVIAISRLQLLRTELARGQFVLPETDGDASITHQQAMNDARALGDAIAQVPIYAKEGNFSGFVVAVRQFSGSLSGLSSNSLQTLALLTSNGTDAENMFASIDSLVSAKSLIQDACVPLNINNSDEIPSHEELVNIASRLARQTKTICDTCKAAVGRSSDVNVRRRYVELAKEVATATTQLVQAIKDQQPDLGPPDLMKLNNASIPLLTSVDALVEFVRSAALNQHESNVEARQQEFAAALTNTLDVGCHMLDTAKALVSKTEEGDTAPYQAYSSHSSQLSSCIKNILSGLRTENLESQRFSYDSNIQSPPTVTPVQKTENALSPPPQRFVAKLRFLNDEKQVYKIWGYGSFKCPKNPVRIQQASKQVDKLTSRINPTTRPSLVYERQIYNQTLPFMPWKKRPQPPPPPPRPANLAAKLAASSSNDATDPEKEASEHLAETAERELMSAAKQISAVARRLSEMQAPRQQSGASGHMEDVPSSTLHFHEQIIEACRALASVTQSLVRSASEAQRELMDQGRMMPAGSHQLYAADDSQWSQGLISAAKLVTEATQNLCESADQLLRGTGSEEKVIAAARQVASCTTQLVLACRVKADPNSETYNRLQTAGQAVKSATETLVATVQQLLSGSNPDDDLTAEELLGQTRVGGLTQIINMHEEVMRRERELEEARRRLAKIYKGQYNRNVENGNGGPSGGSFYPPDFDSNGGSGALTGF